MQSDKTDNTGYEGLGNSADHEVGRDPILYPLVKYYDQHTDYSI